MQSEDKELRDAFWAQPPQLPAGLSLERNEPIVVTRAGRGGVAIFDTAELVAPTGKIPLLVTYRPRLLAGQVGKLGEQLSSLATQRRERLLADGASGLPTSTTVIVTDVARPSVLDACRQAGVGLVDQRGTVVLQGQGTFIFVEGKGEVERPWRGRLFSGKASRIVRFLLTKVAYEPTAEPRTAQAFAEATDLSYAYCHGVLTKLERDGFVERRSPRSGFRLKDPLGLLRLWLKSDEPTAVVTEPYYCSATTQVALVKAAQKLKDATGTSPVFSLASALEADEVHVAALPHGVYWNGEASRLVEAFSLRPTTPHNFLLLRPDPITWTAAGGLLIPSGRDDLGPAAPRVSLAQLAADFATLPGRGREQAEHLVGVYAKSLPYYIEE